MSMPKHAFSEDLLEALRVTTREFFTERVSCVLVFEEEDPDTVVVSPAYSISGVSLPDVTFYNVGSHRRIVRIDLYNDDWVEIAQLVNGVEGVITEGVPITVIDMEFGWPTPGMIPNT